ncbi:MULTISPECIES: radical SAM/SPASM domain-containing protein [Acetivibrio]|jgi:2-deoxy-scyllo-inosamine dehydrogenase (SAM-dependent)/8-amino-3,8-dideoxy-alpha-D-manno-octulosonate transaminase|nr:MULTISPECIES: radical SAM/SPASM domain-containing protein [Acetivibrio]
MVEIEINSQCNRKCSYCPNSFMKRKEQGEMESKVFYKLLESLRKIKFDGRISYHFFGEPLLCKNLIPYVKETKIQLPDSKIFLYSNGDYLDREKLVLLNDYGVDKFIITNHQGNGHRFQKVYDHISDNLKEKVTYLTSKELNLVNRGGLLEGVGGNVISERPCIVPKNLLVITCKGNVVYCFNDYCQVHTMGNIMERDLIDIWNDEVYVRIRTELAEGKRSNYEVCKVCNHYSALTEDGLDFEL